MPVLRFFLGNRERLLAGAARWLLEHAATSDGSSFGPIDLEPVLVLVPGRRAGRRLLAHLAETARSSAPGLLAPTVATPGALPELLCRLPPVTGEVEELWHRAEVLAEAPGALLEPLLPDPPARGDLLAWVDLARDLERLDDELAAEALDTSNVLAVLERDGAPEAELRRWGAIDALRVRFEQRLAVRSRASRARARLRALGSSAAPALLERPDRRSDRLQRAVLVGVTDRPRLFRKLLAASGLEVVALVAAPSERAADFDDFGCPLPAAFAERELDDSRASVVIADGPLAQAGCAAAAARRGVEEQGFAPHEIAIATASVESVELLADALQRAGLPHHLPTGRALRESQPAVLLRAVSEYLAEGTIESLGRLLRLPVVEPLFEARAERARARLLEACAKSATGSRPRRAIEEGRYLVAFDRVVETCLQPLVRDQLASGGPEAALLREADEVVTELLGQRATASRGVGTEEVVEELAPAFVVAALLERAFGERSLDLQDAADAETAQALAALADRLRQLAALPAAAFRRDRDAADPIPAAIRFLLATLEDERLADDGGAGGVEVVGWLDVALDDAPCLIAMDLVEGLVPASGGRDPFLPDSLRSRLGVLDDRRRLVRDLHLLESALAARDAVVLLSRRREADGQPARPSRLLLRRRGVELAERLESLLRRQPLGVPRELWPWLDRSEFQVAPPEPHEEPLVELPVTAFDDYLACPHRFYLRRVLGLERARERPAEIEAAVFGALAHEVLRRFALGSAAASAVEGEIERALLHALREVATESLRGVGAVPRVQLAQLERRLSRFAAWQAAETRDGWRIDPTWVERDVRGTLEVDGAPFVVHGRIDRVDRHRDGAVRILDYKTGERPESPAASHGGPKQANGRPRPDRPWRSLQLPLYAHLAREAGLEGVDGRRGSWPLVGVYALSKKLAAPAYLEAPWDGDDLESALERAREVVRLLRLQVYGPPGPPPPWDDGFGAVVGDRYAARYKLRLVSPGGGA